MSEWWSYRLEDLLLFSPRVYWRMFELQNSALWPLPLIMLGAGVAMVVLVTMRIRIAGRGIALALAILWAFVGWSFLWNRYAGINWSAAYIAPAFALEALLLFLAGILPNGLTLDQQGLSRWIGYLLLVAALAGLPLLAPFQGRDWASSEVFGIAPDPTAIGTLGFLFLARGRLLPWLLPIPALWCLLSGMTLQTMGEAQAVVPLVTLALVAVAWLRILIRRRASPHTAAPDSERAGKDQLSGSQN